MESLRSYAQGLASEWLANESCSHYLDKTESFVEEEHSRVEDCLQNKSTEVIAEALREELLANKKYDIVQKPTGLDYMIKVLLLFLFSFSLACCNELPFMLIWYRMIYVMI